MLAKSPKSVLRLFSILFEKPIITVSEAAKGLGISYPSAKKALESLQSKGIVKKEEGRPARFIASSILAIYKGQT